MKMTPTGMEREIKRLDDINTELGSQILSYQRSIAALEAELAAFRSAEIDWRQCPHCLMEWPHVAVTSTVACPRCMTRRIAELEAELAGERSLVRHLQNVLNALRDPEGHIWHGAGHPLGGPAACTGECKDIQYALALTPEQALAEEQANE